MGSVKSVWDESERFYLMDYLNMWHHGEKWHIKVTKFSILEPTVIGLYKNKNVFCISFSRLSSISSSAVGANYFIDICSQCHDDFLKGRYTTTNRVLK